jgi:hypothetical protein
MGMTAVQSGPKRTSTIGLDRPAETAKMLAVM